jgi:hypothetical protein
MLRNYGAIPFKRVFSEIGSSSKWDFLRMSINEVVCIVRLSEPPLHPLLIVGRSCGKIGRWNLCKKHVLYGFMPGPYIIDNRSRSGDGPEA